MRSRGDTVLEAQTDFHGARAVVRLRGEVDLATAPKLAETIDAALEHQGLAALAIDLDEVTLFDSSGLRVLLRGRAAAREQGVSLTVHNAHGIVGEAFRVTNVSGLFGLPESV